MNVTIVDYQSGNISSVINSFAEVAKGNVNIEVTSDIKKIESCYKGLARSLKDALAIDKRIKNSIPSTKGSI